MKCDLAIIGSGLTGLSAAIAAYSRNPDLNIKTFGIPFDSNTAKKGDIETIPGIKKVVGVDFIQQILDQLDNITSESRQDGSSEELGKIDITNEEVFKVSRTDESYLIKTEQNEYFAKSVIISIGLPESKNKIKGEDKFVHKGVSYCAVCDGALFRGKKVAIIGEGNFVARGALFLRKYCRKVTLLCPKKDIGCDKRFLRQIQAAENITIEVSVSIDTIEISGNQMVETIEFQDNNNEIKNLAVNAVFIEMKDKPDMSIFSELELELSEEGFIVTNILKRTSVEGIFAAGTITGELDYAPILMGDGYKAGISATKFLEEKIE